MDFIIFGITIFIIVFIVWIINYYRPTIDFIYNEDSKSIVLWYSKHETYAGVSYESRYYKTLITF